MRYSRSIARTPTRTPVGKLIREQVGVVLIEGIFSFILLTVLLLGLIDIGFLLISHFSLNQVAREAVTQLTTIDIPPAGFSIDMGDINAELDTTPCLITAGMTQAQAVTIAKCKIRKAISSSGRSKLISASNLTAVVKRDTLTNQITIILSCFYLPPIAKPFVTNFLSSSFNGGFNLKTSATEAYLWPPFALKDTLFPRYVRITGTLTYTS